MNHDIDISADIKAISDRLAQIEAKKELMRARQFYTQGYCDAKGWNIDKLNRDQILEIRSHERWVKPHAKY